MNTLVLTANPLTQNIIEQCQKKLNLTETETETQTNQQSCKLTLPQSLAFSKTEINQRLSPLAQTLNFDFVVTPNDLKASAFKLLAMDMDSTLITIECIDEIADFAGKKQEVSAITEATMRGEIKNFADSLVQRVALLKGLPDGILEQVFNERLQLSPGAETLIKFAKHHGWKTLLVSGGFTFFTHKLQKQLGLDDTHANILESIDGKLTGKVKGPIVDGQAKKEALLTTCKQHDIDLEQTIAIGDGANDLPMMHVAGVSIAYKAKPAVQTQTDFQINFGGLDTLTYWFN